jgi:hypothetical protein
MSMRYFTLSAVCMLIFCMLLALSGTTDFPGSHSGFVSPSGAAATAPGLGQLGKQEAMASVVPLPEDEGLFAGTDGSKETKGGNDAGNRPLLFLGIVLVAGWVLLSFRLLSNSRD